MLSKDINDIGIILQGVPTSKIQLKDLYNYYTSYGIETVISSYSQYVDANQLNFINNDDILGKHEVKTPGKYNNCNIKNVNYQILTSKAGVLYFNNNANINYILKLRADLKISNIDQYLFKWKSLIDSQPSIKTSPLSKKLLTLGRAGHQEMHPWYLSDYFYFGNKHDQNIFWNIPLVPFENNLRRPEEYISSAFLGGWDNVKNSHIDYFIFDAQSANDIYSYKWKRDLTFSIARGN